MTEPRYHPGVSLPGLRFETLSGFLFHLSPDALRAIARYHRSVAALAAKRATELDAHRRMLARAAATVAGTPVPDTPDQRKRLGRRQRVARRIEIVRLATRGWSNAMIAKRLGLHPVTVSKELRKALAPQIMDDF